MHPFVDAKPAPATLPNHLPKAPLSPAAPLFSRGRRADAVKPVAPVAPVLPEDNNPAPSRIMPQKPHVAAKKAIINRSQVEPVVYTAKVNDDLQGLHHIVLKNPNDEAEKVTLLRWLVQRLLPLLGLIVACALVWYLTKDM